MSKNHIDKFDPRLKLGTDTGSKQVYEKPTAETPKITFEKYLATFLEMQLSPFHTILSEKNVELKDQYLDLAVDKIASAITSINKRIIELKKAGKYGEAGSKEN